MDYFHWKLNDPGNRQGIVLADDDLEAKLKVVAWINDFDYPLDDITVEWLSSDSTDVFDINEL